MGSVPIYVVDSIRAVGILAPARAYPLAEGGGALFNGRSYPGWPPIPEESKAGKSRKSGLSPIVNG